jgi:malate synthase
MNTTLADGIEIKGSPVIGTERVLTPEACAFLVSLHRQFNKKRKELLQLREDRQKRINNGELPTFLPETEHIRSDNTWSVAETPAPLQKRWVEITGPTDRKMVINALNSGANVFMADFEDANSPTWSNMIEGQVNLMDAVREDISLTTPQGKNYILNPQHATLFVRSRGWHLQEKHVIVDGEEMSGSLFDFGLFFFHNAKELISRGKGPYFYLAKLEGHLEARLWNDVFTFAQKQLSIPHGSIRATVLIETILAVFEMEEILYELRDHSAGFNAGRWDYIFSVIKKFRRQKDACLPDRDQVTMTVPFMRAYTELLVKTCHKRKAHAMGGMAAFIPNRKDPQVTESALKKVREDKQREANDGFDGTWVAHPDLVPVAREIFEAKLGDCPNQKDRLRDDVHIQASDLIHFPIEGSTITEQGLRHNINVGLQYIASWLRGVGAAAIYNLMEDAATAEISRAQIWQWIEHQKQLDDGRTVTQEMVRQWIPEELVKIQKLYGEFYSDENFQQAKEIFEELIFAEHFIEFLTLPAYKKLQ